MSQGTVYLAGYSGREPAWLPPAAARLDAVVYDIRHAPRSRFPEWSKGRLSAVLGDSYVHVPGWGNPNYRGGPILLADAEAGLAAFDAETRPVILLCQCRETRTCHRHVVADLLTAERGVTAMELDEALAALELRQERLWSD